MDTTFLRYPCRLMMVNPNRHHHASPVYRPAPALAGLRILRFPDLYARGFYAMVTKHTPLEDSRYMDSNICGLIAIVAMLVFVSPSPTHAQSNGELSLEDVLVLVPAPSHVQSTIIERRCVSFAVDASAAQRLRAAGADDSFIAVVRDACEVAFREAESVGTTAAYANYIARNPNGRFLAEARRRHARLEETDTFQAAVRETRGPAYQYYAYLRYLRRYPTGSRATEARAAMERLLQ
jgi:hypothetical protein